MGGLSFYRIQCDSEKVSLLMSLVIGKTGKRKERAEKAERKREDRKKEERRDIFNSKAERAAKESTADVRGHESTRSCNSLFFVFKQMKTVKNIQLKSKILLF